MSNDSGRDTRSGRDRRDEQRDRAARHARRPILPLPHRLELLKFREARLDAVKTAEDAFNLGVAHSQNHTPPRGPDEYPLRLAGSVLTASFWNTQVRDNFVELAPFSAAWTSWTPSFAGGFANGNATRTGKYIKVGRFVAFYGTITTGSTTTYGAVLRATLPVTAASANDGMTVFGHFLDASVGRQPAFVIPNSTTEVEFASINVAGTYAASAQTNATVPFTWTTGDGIFYAGSYEAAS